MRTNPADHELQRLYDSEINFTISTFWDGGFDWRLGDEMNGFCVVGSSDTFAGAVEEICAAAKKKYPTSVFTKESIRRMALWRIRGATRRLDLSGGKVSRVERQKEWNEQFEDHSERPVCGTACEMLFVEEEAEETIAALRLRLKRVEKKYIELKFRMDGLEK